MTPALFVALALAQPPAGPLSPADLPPPPRPAAPAPPVRRAGPAGEVFISTNVWQATGSPDEIGRKALAVLAGYRDVRYAAVGPGGAVEGYTSDTRVAVFAVPIGPKCWVYAAATSQRKQAAAALSKAVQDGVEARPTAPAPAAVGRPDPGVAMAVPALDWHAEVRPAARLARHTKPLALFLLDRAGFVPDPGFDGSAAGVVGVPFESPDLSTGGWQFVIPGVFGLDLQYVTVTATAPGLAPRPARPLGEALTRLLYD